MANLFFTGFNGISTATILRRFSGGSGTNTTVGATGRFGQGCTIADANDALRLLMSGTPATLVVGFAVKVTTASSSGRQLIQFQNSGGSIHCQLTYESATNTLKVYDANSSNPFTSSALSLNTWYMIEVKVTFANSGAFELVIDGTTVYTGTGVDTMTGSEAFATKLSFGSLNLTTIYDCIYVNDTTGSAPHNGYYGNVRADALLTTGDSGTPDFTPLSSTNESNIDDGNTPDDDTSYNSSSTAGHIDRFTVGGYTAPGDILCVAVRAMVKLDVSGSRTFRTKLKSNTTEVNGTAATLSTAYQEVAQYATADPNTAADWADDTAVNAALLGYELVT